MPFDVQLVGVSIGAKTRGFSHSHTMTTAIGTRHHQPSHTRLQIARIISGIAAKRVHTLHGLAWRCHASSVIRNVSPTRDMTAMDVIVLANVDATSGDYALRHV